MSLTLSFWVIVSVENALLIFQHVCDRFICTGESKFVYCVVKKTNIVLTYFHSQDYHSLYNAYNSMKKTIIHQFYHRIRKNVHNVVI